MISHPDFDPRLQKGARNSGGQVDEIGRHVPLIVGVDSVVRFNPQYLTSSPGVLHLATLELFNGLSETTERISPENVVTIETQVQGTIEEEAAVALVYESPRSVRYGTFVDLITMIEEVPQLLDCDAVLKYIDSEIEQIELQYQF